jgi:hypothetical protein
MRKDLNDAMHAFVEAHDPDSIRAEKLLGELRDKVDVLSADERAEFAAHCRSLSSDLVHVFDRPQLNRYGEILAGLPERLGLTAEHNGHVLKRELQSMHGGAYSSEELEAVLGLAAQQGLDDRRKRFGIVYWNDADGHIHYPKWQFGETGAVRPIVEKLLRVLRSEDPGHVLSFFLLPADGLGGKRVVELMGDPSNERILLKHAEKACVWQNV